VSASATDATSGVAGALTSTLDGIAIGASAIRLSDLTLGNHRFVSMAGDAAGNPSQTSVTFRVVATIDSLIEAVRLYGATGAIDSGTYRGLMAKLTDAKDAYARGNREAARRKLGDFINQCTAAKGNGISPAAADWLIADARWVQNNL
jgi:hypothetical protein